MATINGWDDSMFLDRVNVGRYTVVQNPSGGQTITYPAGDQAVPCDAQSLDVDAIKTYQQAGFQASVRVEFPVKPNIKVRDELTLPGEGRILTVNGFRPVGHSAIPAATAATKLLWEALCTERPG
jgi:hypothetical protein